MKNKTTGVVVAILVIIGLIFWANSGGSKANCENPEIKGNISADGERIYHLPGGQYYGRTGINTSNGERWFCTETEAIDAGWRKSLR